MNRKYSVVMYAYIPHTYKVSSSIQAMVHWRMQFVFANVRSRSTKT